MANLQASASSPAGLGLRKDPLEKFQSQAQQLSRLEKERLEAEEAERRKREAAILVASATSNVYERAFGKAMEECDRALRLDPKSVTALGTRGSIWKRLGYLPKALEDFSHALELDPSRATLWANRAVVKNVMGDDEGCIADCDKSLKMNDVTAATFATRAAARFRLGDKTGAIADCNTGLKLDPRDELCVRTCYAAKRALFLEKEQEEAKAAAKVESDLMKKKYRHQVRLKRLERERKEALREAEWKKYQEKLADHARLEEEWQAKMDKPSKIRLLDPDLFNLPEKPRKKPTVLTYGSAFKLQHVSTSARLHAHAAKYPGGSRQSIVTCFYGSDDSDWWVVKAEHGKEEQSGEVPSGAIIRLEHWKTKRNLHSDQISAHSARVGRHSKQNPKKEVCCFGEDGNGDTNCNWRVLYNQDPHGALRLQHVNLGKQYGNHFLNSHDFKYPEWGFGQQEVTLSPHKNSDDLWRIQQMK